MSNIIKFKKIILDSFMSYDHEEVDLDAAGIVYIRGENNNESKTDSNGSGKSALISESLLWGLTGKTSRGASEVKNLFLDRGAYVTIQLSKNENIYEITRGTVGSLKPNGLTIIKNGENVTKARISDTKEYFEQEFPELSWSVLTSTINLTQGLVGGFSNLSNRDRKAKLEELSKIDNFYELIKTLVDSRHRSIDTALTVNKNKINEVLYQIKAKQDVLVDIENSVAEINEKAQQAVNVKDIALSYTAELQNLDSLIEANQSEIALKNAEITKKNEKLLDLHTKLSKVSTAQAQATLKLQQATLESSKLQDIVSKLTSREAHFKVNHEAKTCPTCMQVLNQESQLLVQTSLAAELATIERERDIALAAIDKCSKEISEAQYLMTEINAIEVQISAAIAIIKQELASLTAHVTSFSQSIEVAKQDKMQVSRKITELEALNTASFTHTLELLSANKGKEEAAIQELQAQMELHQASADTTAEKHKISTWVVNNMARGLRSYLLEGVVDFINMRCAEYSGYLFDTDLISLSIDGSALEIYLGQKPIENTSGGEHRRADIVIQLAIRDLVAEQSGLVSNLLIIDEVFDGLDSIGIAAVLDLVTSQKDTINSIYLITHKSDANIDYDKMVLVKKDSNISRVVY